MDDAHVFSTIDDIIDSLSLNDLEQVRLNMIREHKNTEVVDKVIKRKKEEQEEITNEERQLRRMYRNAAVGGILS